MVFKEEVVVYVKNATLAWTWKGRQIHENRQKRETVFGLKVVMSSVWPAQVRQL
jgi:hypothetical protein